LFKAKRRKLSKAYYKLWRKDREISKAELKLLALAGDPLRAKKKRDSSYF
jgi:hypothetical protein